jgi:hypothetical protein
MRPEAVESSAVWDRQSCYLRRSERLFARGDTEAFGDDLVQVEGLCAVLQSAEP